MKNAGPWMEALRLRRRPVAAIVLVLVVGVTAGTIYQASVNGPPIAGYLFSATLFTSSSEPYWIVIPFPVLPNGSVSPFLATVGVAGNATWEIIETPLGVGLNITGRGNVTLGSTMTGPYLRASDPFAQQRFLGGQVGLSPWRDVPEPHAGDVVGEVSYVTNVSSLVARVELHVGDVAHVAQAAMSSAFFVEWAPVIVTIKQP